MLNYHIGDLCSSKTMRIQKSITMGFGPDELSTTTCQAFELHD